MWLVLERYRVGISKGALAVLPLSRDFLQFFRDNFLNDFIFSLSISLKIMVISSQTTLRKIAVGTKSLNKLRIN